MKTLPVSTLPAPVEHTKPDSEAELLERSEKLPPQAEHFEKYPHLAVHWFQTELETHHPEIYQAFSQSDGYCKILNFIGWAGVRSHLRTSTAEAPSSIQLLNRQEIEELERTDSGMVLTQEQWEVAVEWKEARQDGVLQGVEQYGGKHSDVICLIAWCLERGYLETKEAAQ